MNYDEHQHHHHGDESPSRGRGPRDRGRGRAPGSHRGGHFARGEAMFRGGFPRSGRRLRRGDVRAAILLLLEEQPRNGYQLIQELTERSDGAWRPSPGSVYPVLQQLEDEGLIEPAPGESGKTFQLSAKGRESVERDRATLGKPWESAAADVSDAMAQLGSTLRQVAMATRQVMTAASENQVQRAVTVLSDARKALYKILADDEE